jgi:hypothetical protein
MTAGDYRGGGCRGRSIVHPVDSHPQSTQRTDRRRGWRWRTRSCPRSAHSRRCTCASCRVAHSLAWASAMDGPCRCSPHSCASRSTNIATSRLSPAATDVPSGDGVLTRAPGQVHRRAPVWRLRPCENLPSSRDYFPSSIAAPWPDVGLRIDRSHHDTGTNVALRCHSGARSGSPQKRTEATAQEGFDRGTEQGRHVRGARKGVR